MFSALTITSAKQGFAFDAAASASAYAAVERIVGFGGALLRGAARAIRAARTARQLPSPARLARA